MIDRFIHDDFQNDMREYENGDYVLYEDYKELKAENAILKEREDGLNNALKLADDEIDRLRKALEEIQSTDNFLEIWDIAKETLKQEK